MYTTTWMIEFGGTCAARISLNCAVKFMIVFGLNWEEDITLLLGQAKIVLDEGSFHMLNTARDVLLLQVIIKLSLYVFSCLVHIQGNCIRHRSNGIVGLAIFLNSCTPLGVRRMNAVWHGPREIIIYIAITNISCLEVTREIAKSYFVLYSFHTPNKYISCYNEESNITILDFLQITILALWVVWSHNKVPKEMY